MEEVGSDLELPDWYKDSELENVDVNFLSYENLTDDLFLLSLTTTKTTTKTTTTTKTAILMTATTRTTTATVKKFFQML